MGPTKKNVLWYATVFALSVAVATVIWLRAPATNPPRPVVSAYYVWQLQWNDGVRDAVRVADSSANAFMVLIGEVNVTGGELRFQRGFPDWIALSKTNAPITIVLRANAALSDMLQGDARDKTIAFVANTLYTTISDAAGKGLRIRGIQLDYDCPSAKLALYKTFVDALRPRYTTLEFSITALPTWLKRREFEGLVRGLTYYVLQVHSLDPPSRFNDPITLCDTARIPGYLRRAASIGTPYYLALPTYGYRFVFDEKGTFTAIIAEGPEPELKPGYRVRTVMTDPNEIAAAVGTIRANPPYGLLGFVWFRLPIASDDLNWPWQALEAVRDGRAPKTAFAAEVRNPTAGLYEIYVTNTGETAPAGDVRTRVQHNSTIVIGSDTHNGFVAIDDTASTNLRGPAPRPGQSVLAAWFRIRENGEPAKSSPFAVTSVSIDD